jgi:hypothetical protein
MSSDTNTIKPLATEETLAALSAKIPSLGATGATGSTPVVCAQLPAVIGATAGSASVSVVPATDSGLATYAGQTAGNATLSAISGKLPAALGATGGSASLSIVPATDADMAKATANGPSASLYWPAQVYAGTGSTGGTGPAQFAAQACAIGAWFQGDPNNTKNVGVGPSDVALSGAVKGRPLIPGEEVFVPCSNTNQVYHCGEDTGQKINVRGA